MKKILLRYNYKKLNNNGFTLVEIIVVLVIMAILAAISFPAVTGYLEDVNFTKNARNIRNAMNASMAEAFLGRYNFDNITTGDMNTKAVYCLFDVEKGEVIQSESGNWDANNKQCADTRYATKAKNSYDGKIYKYVAVKVPYSVLTQTKGNGNIAEEEICVCPHFSDYNGGTLWTNNPQIKVDPGFWYNDYD